MSATRRAKAVSAPRRVVSLTCVSGERAGEAHPGIRGSSQAGAGKMALFEDPPLPSGQLPKPVRLFPLPNLVLFPHVIQPLHVFEDRYRELLEAALDSDGLIAMAVLAQGWEQDYDGRPALLPTACLGRITAHHRLDDGSYNVLLVGLNRVRLLKELPPTRSYREASVEVLEDVYQPAPAAALPALMHRLRAALARILPQSAQAEEQWDQLFSGEVPLGGLTDVISHMLDIELEKKQALLAEVNVNRRAELLLSHLADAATDLAPGRSGRSAFPPELGLN